MQALTGLSGLRGIVKAPSGGGGGGGALSDDFIGVTGSALQGRTLSSGNAVWQQLQGDWRIDANRAYNGAPVTGQSSAVVANLGAANQDVSTTFVWGANDNYAGTPTGAAGVVLRVNPGNFTEVECYIEGQLSVVAVTEKNASTRVGRGTVPFVPVLGQTYTVRATAIGNQIQVYVNGVLKLTVTLAFNSDQTYCGLWTWDKLTDGEGYQYGDDKHRFSSFSAAAP